jgi:tetratricopeptide (TPR) repeat protein
MKSRAFAVLLLAGSAFAQLDPSNIQRLDMTSVPAPSRTKKSVFSEFGYSQNAVVSVSEFSIPARARKEFDKSNEALRKEDFKLALHRLNQAVSICPEFASAYNNLGVVFARLGDAERERQSLQTAISLNDHFALAYLNWGRMDIGSSNFADAESALRKAVSLDSSDPIALVLLAYSELMQGKLQGTLATSEEAHRLAKPHAFAHRVAARAYEQQNQFDRAIAELKVSLEEEPTGSRADAARQELKTVQAILR